MFKISFDLESAIMSEINNSKCVVSLDRIRFKDSCSCSGGCGTYAPACSCCGYQH